MVRWKLYLKPTHTPDVKFPWFAMMAFYVLVIGAALAIRILSWPDGKPVDVVMFLTQTVTTPFIIISTIAVYLMMILQADNYYHASKQIYFDWKLYHMKVFARKYLVIAGWSSVAPVKDIALQMLKLEGEFPLAPKTPLIIETEAEFEATRTKQIFTKLVVPLAEKLKKYSGFDVTLWVRGAEEAASDDLLHVFQEQGITVEKEITILSECPDYLLLNKMITESDNLWNYRHLLIIVDLYGDTESKCMENAIALFICNDYSELESPKPVLLFQPMTSDQDLAESTPVFIATGQTQPPKTLWYSGLSKSEKYPLFKVLGENKVAPDRLDLELSFGEYSAGYKWLALVIASDAVRYAQGAQLVATSEKNKPGLAVLSSEQPFIPSEPNEAEYAAPPIFIAILAALLAALSAGLGWGSYVGKPDFFWLTLFVVINFIITVAIGWGLTMSVSQKAYNAVNQ